MAKKKKRGGKKTSAEAVQSYKWMADHIKDRTSPVLCCLSHLARRRWLLSHLCFTVNWDNETARGQGPVWPLVHHPSKRTQPLFKIPALRRQRLCGVFLTPRYGGAFSVAVQRASRLNVAVRKRTQENSRGRSVFMLLKTSLGGWMTKI